MDCPTRPWDNSSDDSNDYDFYFNAQPVSSRNNTTKPTDSTAITCSLTPIPVISDLSGVAGGNDIIMSTDREAVAHLPTPTLVISDLSGAAGMNNIVMSTDSAAIMHLPTPTQVVSDLSGMAGRNDTVMFTYNAAITHASTPILVISKITSMGSDTTTMASSMISMISDLTSYVTFDFTSMGSDVNKTTSSSISDLTSSSGLISVAAPSIPPSIPSTTSSLIDPPQTLTSLMAFPITFNNEHYDLYINFNWMHPVFTDWAYEQWGYLEVVLLPPVKVKVDIKAVCSVVGYTLDYIPTKERGPFVELFNHIIQNPAVIPGECWDLNRQFQEYLPQSPTDLHISILYHNDDDQPLYIVKPRVPQIPCPTWTLLLHDSITILQIFHHHNRSTIYNILCHLLYYGILFSITIPKDTLPPPLPFCSVPTLGWHPVGHRIKPFEYAFYHNQLLYFFKQPYSRAAFGMGGIVWCLAHTMVSDDLADSLVINGPSNAVGNSHSSKCFMNESILCNNSFTEQELDFICGVYKIVTGNVFFFAVNYLVKLTCLIIIGHADQTTDVS